jgi:hypothetical protein
MCSAAPSQIQLYNCSVRTGHSLNLTERATYRQHGGIRAALPLCGHDSQTRPGVTGPDRGTMPIIMPVICPAESLNLRRTVSASDSDSECRSAAPESRHGPGPLIDLKSSFRLPVITGMHHWDRL